jgi:hypothetical protein
MSLRVPHSKNFRHRLYGRQRHGRRMANLLTDLSTLLGSSASAQTVTPVRTTNTKAEALITFGGNLSNSNTLTVGPRTYTFKTALTEVLAFATLTNDGSDVANGETVVIDGVTYTFKTTLTEVKATGTLTNDGSNVTNNDTVTIGSKVYTFQDTLTNVDGHVKIGASNTATMTNLFHAINASGGTVGTDYATATVANTQVTATNPSGTTVVITAIVPGTAANSIATTEASTHLAWGGATLSGGVASVANEVKRGVSNTASMTSLYEAINAGANRGTDYSYVTTAHTSVTATNPTGTTVKVTAVTTVAATGNAITVSETSTHLTWGTSVTTLSGGVSPVLYEVLVDDTAAHTRDNVMNAINGGTGAGTKYSTGTPSQSALVVASASSGDLLLTAADVADIIPGTTVPIAKSAANLTLPGTSLDGPFWTATSHAFVDGEGPVLLTNSGGALPTGSPTAGTELYVHVVSASRIALATSPEALRKGNFIQTTSAGTGTHSVTRSVTASGLFGLLKRNKPRTAAAASDIDSLN